MSGMTTMTLRQVRDEVRSGQRSALEVCEAVLARIEAHNPTLNAFNTVTRERALERAAAVEDRKSTRLNSSH